MKKLSFMIVAALLVTLISCKKEEVKETPKKTTAQTNTNNLARTGKWVAYNGPDRDCAGEGDNCYEFDIVIINRKYQYIKSAALSGSSGEVGGVFNDPDMQDVCAEMDPAIVTMLQSGTYFMSVNYEDANVINFIAGQDPQLTAQNMEFAFQLKKQ